MVYKEISANLLAQGLKIGIVVSRFNDFLTKELLGGAVDCLVRHEYAQHVRELERFLWGAMTRSRGQHLALTEELEELFAAAPDEAAPALELTPEVIQASLDRHEGQQAEVCAELGLRNRHVLYRLIRKHGLDARKVRASAPPPAAGCEPPAERSR